MVSLMDHGPFHQEKLAARQQCVRSTSRPLLALIFMMSETNLPGGVCVLAVSVWQRPREVSPTLVVAGFYVLLCRQELISGYWLVKYWLEV